MTTEKIDQLLQTLEVNLKEFAICEIANGWRLKIDPLEAVLLHFVLHGDGFLEVDGSRTSLPAGTLIIVPPGIPKSLTGLGQVLHEVEAVEGCTLHTDGLVSFSAREEAADLLVGCATLAVSLGYQQAAFAQLREPLVLRLPHGQLHSESLRLLTREMLEPKLGSMVMAECLMRHIIVLLLREHFSEVGMLSPLVGSTSDPRVHRAARLIITNPAEPHTLASLASAAGMSRSSFAVHFSKEYGATPLEFLQRVRLQSAARLLEVSEIPIKALAALVGYSSRSHFSQVFRQMYGLDPSGYRATAKGRHHTERES